MTLSEFIAELQQIAADFPDANVCPKIDGMTRSGLNARSVDFSHDPVTNTTNVWVEFYAPTIEEQGVNY